MNTVNVENSEAWRTWLAAHHASESEIWLVFHKRHTGRPSIPYEDAVDEALCFGWVDSLIKRIDDSRYARKFTPRKADSRWSTANRRRYARLKENGRLMPAGLNRAPTARSYDPPRSRSMPSKLPECMRKELKKNAVAERYFETLPPSHRRNYVRWIDSAKQSATKLRRLQEAIRLLSSGKRLGLK